MSDVLGLKVAEYAERAGQGVAEKGKSAADAIGRFDESHGHVITRAGGALQAAAGTAEVLGGAALAGLGGAATATGAGAAPGIPTMIGGGLLAANGLDQAQAGVRTLVTGKPVDTALAKASEVAARKLGASDEAADKIKSGVGLVQGVAGLGAGVALKVTKSGEASILKEAPPALTGEALELSTSLAKAAPGSPERAKLVAGFAKLSTHVKPPPDRVVLGKWEPPGKGGYIDAAKEKGGIWYETPEGSYGVVGRDAAWESNKVFLEQQMQQGVPKLEFANVQLDQAVADAARAKGLPEKMPARLKEVQFLEETAAQYGYTRVGNSYVKAPQ